VRGNVSAEDWIEVKSGGVIRGDVRAPRVVLHDGAVVTGRIDMSQAAVRRHAQRFDPLVIPPRPGMRKVLRKRSAPR
jgi:cytoskeletal protein CcmA (bactofilin family)